MNGYKTRGREKILMGLDGLEVKNDCAGEGQQLIIRDNIYLSVRFISGPFPDVFPIVLLYTFLMLPVPTSNTCPASGSRFKCWNIAPRSGRIISS
jgi:hypothetical protein